MNRAKRTIVLLSCFAVLLTIARQSTSQDPNPNLQVRAEAAVSQIRGTLKLAELERAVAVMRDRWRVAHIYAENQHDLFFAQWFVVAQDRLFQMELWKRSGQGRLSEILGPSALARDLQVTSSASLRFGIDSVSEDNLNEPSRSNQT